MLERADDRAVVEQEAVARFMMFSKRVHLVLEVQEDTRDDSLPGPVRQELRPLRRRMDASRQRDGSTHVTYELSAKPSFDVPEFLLKRLLKRDASQMIERLKAEIGARARQPVS